MALPSLLLAIRLCRHFPSVVVKKNSTLSVIVRRSMRLLVDSFGILNLIPWQFF